MKVGSDSSAIVRHARYGTTRASLSAAPPLGLLFLFQHGEKERTNGQVGYTKHIRLYGTSANWPASFLAFFFFRFFFNPATLTCILRSSETRRAWSELSRIESSRKIEPSKKFRDRALNSGRFLSLGSVFFSAAVHMALIYGTQRRRENNSWRSYRYLRILLFPRSFCFFFHGSFSHFPLLLRERVRGTRRIMRHEE